MAGLQLPRRRPRDEAEKPFWISFSDLMSGLMVLFLVAMTVALLAVTHEVSESEREKSAREDDIRQLLAQVREMTRDFPGVTLRGQSVDFGDRARFETNSHKLTADQARLLRQFVPQILALAKDPRGSRWLKQVVVEGFADARGSYLYNLHLSLQRSERVLCALLATPAGDSPADALNPSDRQAVRELFLVGGSSFNFQKASQEESRRIELRLEFRDLGERPDAVPPPAQEGDSRCPLDTP